MDTDPAATITTGHALRQFLENSNMLVGVGSVLDAMPVGKGLIQRILSWLIAIALGIPAACYMTTVVLSRVFGKGLGTEYEGECTCRTKVTEPAWERG